MNASALPFLPFALPAIGLRQAAAIGESGQVLVLDTDEPVKIIDLARDMIRLAGHSV